MLEIHGHRGARGLLPENTLPGFERAIALGVDALELDVGMTRDGVPVVHHDTALNPDHTRDAGGAWLEGPGPLLKDLDVADLRGLDVGRARLGSRTALRFPRQEPRDGARIPTLADVLALGRRPAAGAVRFNVEIKSSPLEPHESAGPEALAQAVAEVLRAEGTVGRATVQSFDWRVLSALRTHAPDVAIACLTSERGWRDTVLRGRAEPSPWTAGLSVDACGGSVPRLVHRFGGAEWMPFHADLTAESLAEARTLGLKVMVWTVNEAPDMEALARLGVDGIVTDYPDRAAGSLLASAPR
ncbi:MAG: glycerophosphodiester phosphodiesterase [Rhodospirillaceae bacterium]|nr:glycerophosphodiester phosphodiesterase [Rhodospirillaceae bacterium]